MALLEKRKAETANIEESYQSGLREAFSFNGRLAVTTKLDVLRKLPLVNHSGYKPNSLRSCINRGLIVCLQRGMSSPVPLPDLYFDSFSYPVGLIVSSVGDIV